MSTRFGRGPNWSKGHVVLLLSKTPGTAPGKGFYVVDDPAGYVTATETGGYGHYGPDQCGEHVIYPEELVRQALLYPDGISARPALVLTPAPGTDPDVLMIIGRFDGPGPPPYQFWLQDMSGRRRLAARRDAGHRHPGQRRGHRPGRGVGPVGRPRGPAGPGALALRGLGDPPADGLAVFVTGDADFALETLRFTAAGVIRSLTTGTVTAGTAQQVTLTAPATYQLTLTPARAGRRRVAGPGTVPRRHRGDADRDAGPGLRPVRLDHRRRRGGRRPTADAGDGRRPHGRRHLHRRDRGVGHHHPGRRVRPARHQHNVPGRRHLLRRQHRRPDRERNLVGQRPRHRQLQRPPASAARACPARSRSRPLSPASPRPPP